MAIIEALIISYYSLIRRWLVVILHGHHSVQYVDETGLIAIITFGGVIYAVKYLPAALLSWRSPKRGP